MPARISIRPLETLLISNPSPPSSDNGHIDEFIWTFSYKGKDTNLMGEIARFNFKYAGIYVMILVVTMNTEIQTMPS